VRQDRVKGEGISKRGRSSSLAGGVEARAEILGGGSHSSNPLGGGRDFVSDSMGRLFVPGGEERRGISMAWGKKKKQKDNSRPGGFSLAAINASRSRL